MSALVTVDLEEAESEATQIGNPYFRSEALHCIALHVARDDLAASVARCTWKSDPAKEFTELMRAYVDNSDQESRVFRLADAINVATAWLTNGTRAEVLALLIDEFARSSPSIARALLPTILGHAPWVHSRYRVETGLANDNQFEPTPSKDVLAVQSSPKSKASRSDHLYFAEIVRTLTTSHDDGILEHALTRLVSTVEEYDVDQQWVYDVMVRFMKNLNEWDSSHRERLIAELADALPKLLEDKQYACQLLVRLSEMLNVPGRLRERHHLDATTAVIRSMNRVLYGEKQAWWSYAARALADQATHGSDHVFVAVLADLPFLEDLLESPLAHAVQEHIAAVDHFFRETLPKIFHTTEASRVAHPPFSVKPKVGA